jgi:peptide methionine sulfoxide reductase msrA/msrB
MVLQASREAAGKAACEIRFAPTARLLLLAILIRFQGDAMATEQATFAAGCFWGVESAFRHVDGVVATAVGYTGGSLANPTYKQVCTGRTEHAEAVLVTFEPSKVSYAELLDVFWSSHDPTTLNRQGPDVGTQYRSAIYFHTPEQEKIARQSLAEAEKLGVFKRKIVTEIEQATQFYSAEDYHQQYFQKQGMEESCHVGIASVHTKLAADAKAKRIGAGQSTGAQPTANNQAAASCDPKDENAACGVSHWKAMSEEELRKKLTPEQYQIARKAGTERAFTGKYWDDHRPGIYHCAVCGQELFDAKTKFESGTGWPSFWQPIKPGSVTENRDSSHGMVRTEAVCSRCQSHLGHVFDDGPRPTGKRYCMNSAVLDLEVKA